MMYPLKRFIALCGESYYPNAWGNLIGSFDNIEDAKMVFKDMEFSQPYPDWCDILDSHTGELYMSSFVHLGENYKRFGFITWEVSRPGQEMPHISAH